MFRRQTRQRDQGSAGQTDRSSSEPRGSARPGAASIPGRGALAAGGAGGCARAGCTAPTRPETPGPATLVENADSELGEIMRGRVTRIA